MNKKAFWKVLALMLVVVLAFALLTACGNKKPADSHDDETPSVTPKEPSDKNTGSSRADRQNAFLDTLFNGANEIVPTDASGNKIKIDTGEGKDIGFNIGLTLTLDIDGEKLPVGISAKAFLDRVTVVKREQKIDKTFASMLAEKVKLPDAEAKVDYDKDEEYPSGTEYWCQWYDTKDPEHPDKTNETVIDISVSVAGAESLGIYYEVKTPEIIYLTVGGNKYAANLARVFKLDKDVPPWMPGLVYNLCERLITSDLVVKLADAFNAGDGFDLNKLFSDLLNKLLEGVLKDGETLYSMLEGVKLAGFNVGDIVFGLFGEGEAGKEKAKDILGEDIDVLGLLKAVKGMILSDPEWTWYDGDTPKKVKVDRKNTGKGSSPEYDSHIAKNLAQHLKAHADIEINVGGLDLNGSTILKDGHIRLGYEKAAGENGKNGKLDNFWLELMLDKIPASDGSSKSFGLKVQIDDLSFFVEKDASIGRNVSEYGPLAFDAEISAKLSQDAFDIFFENDKAGYHVSFGNDKLEITDDGEIKIPETVTISAKGALDLVASEGTKIVLSLTCAGSDGPLATAQIYGKDDKDSAQYGLQGDVKVNGELLNNVTGILKEMSDGRPIGKDGFAWNKTKGKWGFWGEDGNYKEECLEGVSEALNGFLESGEMHIEPIDPFELIEKAKRGTLLINYEGSAEAAAKIDTGGWILNALLNPDKTGAITLFADLFAYAEHTLTIGGKGVLGTVFNNTLYHVDPDDKAQDILSSIYSMLGYFTSDPKLTDIREAYEFLEKKIYDFNTGYKHVRPAAAGKNSADKLIEEWNAAANDKKGGITADLESKGYAVIPTNIDGTAVVHYPMNLFKLVLNDARSKVGQLKADEDIPELGDGFKLVAVEKNFENVTAQDGLSNGSINKNYQIISKSIDDLKTAYKADSSVENAVLLMRRGVVYEKAGEKYNEYDVLVDEQMLSAADLTIEISSENKDGKVSNGSLDVNAAYDGSEAHIGISVKMIKPKDVVIDHGLVSDDCVKVKIGIYKI